MGVVVARGSLTRLREQSDFFVVQVQQAGDVQAAARALEAARGDIAGLEGGHELGGPKYVSAVLPADTGPFIAVDAGWMPYARLRQIPELVVARLVEAGVDEAVVAVPEPGGPISNSVTGLAVVPNAVVLHLFPPPPPPPTRGRRAELPQEWLAEAVRWLGADADDGAPLWAGVVVTEFPLRASRALEFLVQCRRARASQVAVVAGDAHRPARLRLVAANFVSLVPRLSLAAGGPQASDAELCGAVDELAQVARKVAGELGYGCISIDPTFADMMFGSAGDWGREGGGSAKTMPNLCDEYVFDAFCYQVLGPGHLKRLGGTLPGAHPLEAGRVELWLGEPAGWLCDPDTEPATLAAPRPLPRRRDPGIQQRHRHLLAPCLLLRDEARALNRARLRGEPAPDLNAPPRSPS